jgi:transposase
VAPRKADLVQELLDASDRARQMREAGDTPAAELQRQSDLAAKRLEVMALRLAGLTNEQIAERTGVSEHAVDRLIVRHLERTTNLLSEQMRGVENARLDRAQAAIWSRVLQGDIPAGRLFLAYSQRRAAMNGLDAPKKFELSANVRVEMETALAQLHDVVLGEIVVEEVVPDGSGAGPDDLGPPPEGGQASLI